MEFLNLLFFFQRAKFFAPSTRGQHATVRSALLHRSDQMAVQTIGKSIASYKSRMRGWIAFMVMGICVGGVLSATPEDMLMFIALFRNGFSAQKYVQAVRWMYIYLGCPLSWESEKVTKVLTGAKKDTLARGGRRPRRALRWDLLKRLVKHAQVRGEFVQAAAYVIAANFLLRCKDELIGMDFSQLTFDTLAVPVTVTLALASRKNMPYGTTLKRRCICEHHSSLCPYHIFSRLCTATRRSMHGRIFTMSYGSFLNVFRAHLAALDVEGSQEYDGKAFRRGTAQEMVASGSGLAEILTAAQWRSAAFALYLDKADVEEEAVFAALDSLSDDEDQDPLGPPATVPTPIVAPDVPDRKKRRTRESNPGVLDQGELDSDAAGVLRQMQMFD